MVADLVVGFNALKETLHLPGDQGAAGPDRVDYVEGPLKYLQNEWQFEPAPQGGTDVDFCVDFAFRIADVRERSPGRCSTARCGG